MDGKWSPAVPFWRWMMMFKLWILRLMSICQQEDKVLNSQLSQHRRDYGPMVWPILKAMFRAGETYALSPDISEKSVFINWLLKLIAIYEFSLSLISLSISDFFNIFLLTPLRSYFIELFQTIYFTTALQSDYLLILRLINLNVKRRRNTKSFMFL